MSPSAPYPHSALLLLIGLCVVACASEEPAAFRAVGASDAATTVPASDAPTATPDAGPACPSAALSWRRVEDLRGLPKSVGAAAFTPDGLVAAVVNAGSGDGLELYERETLQAPFVRSQFVPSGYVDGVRGLSLSENGTVLLGAGYSQSALAALKRPARGAPFVAMTDMTLTAAFNQAYPRSLVDTSRPALLPDGSVVAFTRATDGQGGFSEKYVWMAGDGKDKSAQLPPRMRLFLGATTAGPQVAWQDSDGRVQLSRTALGAPYAAVPYASVGASGVLSLMDPCVGAFARVLDADSSSDFVFTRLAPSDEVAKFVMEGSSLQ